MNALDRLDGRICLVTGGAQGIGFASALALAKRGATIACLDLSLELANRAAQRITEETSGFHIGVAADVCDETKVRSAVETIERVTGPVTVLVSCAGIITPRFTSVADTPVQDFEDMLAVHLRGAFLCAKTVLPSMKAARFGRIVHISSVLGVLGMPFRIGYAVAKTGVIGLTRSLAVEVGRWGITVNTIAPGYILTDALRRRLDAGMLDYARFAERAPVGRWGLPQEVARVVAFLAEPGSAFITGTIIPVDGGYTVRGDPEEDIGPRPETMKDIEVLFGPGP
jgi:NAD(P)-dependent dehydrogenase (short-subunit alcohol dehydrogenase family)